MDLVERFSTYQINFPPPTLEERLDQKYKGIIIKVSSREDPPDTLWTVLGFSIEGPPHGPRDVIIFVKNKYKNIVREWLVYDNMYDEEAAEKHIDEWLKRVRVN